VEVFLVVLPSQSAAIKTRFTTTPALAAILLLLKIDLVGATTIVVRPQSAAEACFSNNSLSQLAAPIALSRVNYS
jgi:hypothetical protein